MKRYQLRKNLLLIGKYKTGRSIFLLIFVLETFSNLPLSSAQSFIGLNGGYIMSRFNNFSKKEGYDARYQIKNGYHISSFLETKMDSIIFLRIEIQYKFQNASLDVKNNLGHESFYRKIDYSMDYLCINLNYSFPIKNRKAKGFFLLFGPSFSYNTLTQSNGIGWDLNYQTQMGPNGNPIQVLKKQDWQKKESKSNDLSKFTFGLDLGIEFRLKINDKVGFILQNKYNLALTNTTTFEDLRHTSLGSGYLNIGILYYIRQ